jgi:hypothetical protein
VHLADESRCRLKTIDDIHPKFRTMIESEVADLFLSINYSTDGNVLEPEAAAPETVGQHRLWLGHDF